MKSHKIFFLSLKNLTACSYHVTCAFQSTQSTIIRKTLKDEKSLHVINKLVNFYRNLFTEKHNVSKDKILPFLNLVLIPQLTQEQSLLSEEELLRVLIRISKDKSLGSDILTKEFYKTFWEDLKTPIL